MARWTLAKQAKLNLYHFSFYKDNIVIWRYCAEINSYFGATFSKLHFAGVSEVITVIDGESFLIKLVVVVYL